MKDKARKMPVSPAMSTRKTLPMVSATTAAEAMRVGCEASRKPAINSATPKASQTAD